MRYLILLLIIFSCADKQEVIIVKDEVRYSMTGHVLRSEVLSDLIISKDDGLLYYKESMELFSGIWIKAKQENKEGLYLNIGDPDGFRNLGLNPETEIVDGSWYDKSRYDPEEQVTQSSLLKMAALIDDDLNLRERFFHATIDENSYSNGRINGIQKRYTITNRFGVDGIGFGIRGGASDTILTEKFNVKNQKKDGIYESWYINSQIKTRKKYSKGRIIEEDCWDNSGQKINCTKDRKINREKSTEINLENYYIFLDGTKISKDKLMNDCIKSFQESKEENVFKDQGVMMCDCIFEKSVKDLVSENFKKCKEIQKMISIEPTIYLIIKKSKL